MRPEAHQVPYAERSLHPFNKVLNGRTDPFFSTNGDIRNVVLDPAAKLLVNYSISQLVQISKDFLSQFVACVVQYAPNMDADWRGSNYPRNHANDVFIGPLKISKCLFTAPCVRPFYNLVNY